MSTPLVRFWAVEATTLPRVTTENERKALDATRRALPMQRLLGNGMEYSDAVTLHGLAEEGVLWTEAAAWLGDVNLERAGAATMAANMPTACSYYLFASACYRFGQSALIRDDAAKVQLYTRARDAFSLAMGIAEPPGERIEVSCGAGSLSGWLLRPSAEVSCGAGSLSGWLLRPSAAERAPVVIIFGGADGWREEYHAGAEYLLQRGI